MCLEGFKVKGLWCRGLRFRVLGLRFSRVKSSGFFIVEKFSYGVGCKS